ncbi:MAG: hypothetical protein KAV25_10045 [Methanophagales archaeon]|nr:hypothetical protein [Methanophagales archaeon]
MGQLKTKGKGEKIVVIYRGQSNNISGSAEIFETDFFSFVVFCPHDYANPVRAH